MKSLIATPARRRMTVLSLTTVFMAFAAGGFDFLCPLWLVRGLGFTADQWAQLRSLRFTGVLVGVVILGALSDRFGQRCIATISLFGMGVLLAILGAGWAQGIWVVMPIHGALASTAYVNMNALIQGVSARRQGLANTIYRSVGAAVGVIAPIAVTFLALLFQGYPPVLLTLAAVFVVSGIVLLFHPNDVPAKPLGSMRDEMKQLWQGYRTALRERGLMGYIHASQIWGNTLVGVGAFASLRLMELGQSDQQVGVIGTVAGVVTLLTTIGAGFLLDRASLRTMHLVVGVIAGVASMAMGVGNYLGVTIVAFVIFSAVTMMLTAPMSMWVSRAAGECSQTSAFTVHKVFAALYLTAAMQLAGVLVRYIGMQQIFLYGGILSLVATLLYLLLPEPPPAWSRPCPPAD